MKKFLMISLVAVCTLMWLPLDSHALFSGNRTSVYVDEDAPFYFRPTQNGNILVRLRCNSEGAPTTGEGYPQNAYLQRLINEEWVTINSVTTTCSAVGVSDSSHYVYWYALEGHRHRLLFVNPNEERHSVTMLYSVTF